MIRKPLNEILHFRKVHAGDGSLHTVGTVPSKHSKKLSLKKLLALSAALGVSVGFLNSPKGKKFLKEHFKVKVGDRQVFPKTKTPPIKSLPPPDIAYLSEINRKSFGGRLKREDLIALNEVVKKMSGTAPESILEIIKKGKKYKQRERTNVENAEALVKYVKKLGNRTLPQLKKELDSENRRLASGDFGGGSGKDQMLNRIEVLKFLTAHYGTFKQMNNIK